MNNFRKKIHLIFHLRGSKFDSDLKYSDKEYIYRYIAYDILCCKSHLWMNLNKRNHFTSKKEDSFLMSLFLSSCFSIQTRTDLVLVKCYYNAVVRRFLKTFRKSAGKRLWWKPFLGKFKLFKMDSGKGVYLSIFWTPFHGCIQTLNRNAFLWMITLFDANTPESSKIFQKVEAFFYLMPQNT